MKDVNPADLTRRMIDEGAQMLAEQGPAGLSLRKLAAAAGTSTMAVYTRFGDKDGLLAAMYVEGFARLGDRLGAGSGSSPQGLLDLGRAYRSFALDNRYLYGLMFGPAPADLVLSEDNVMTAQAVYQALLDAVLVAVQNDILTGEPQQIARHLWAVVHGMVSLELSGQLPGAPQPAEDRFDDALMFAAAPFWPTEGE